VQRTTASLMAHFVSDFEKWVIDKKEIMPMAKYGKKTQQKVKQAMRERKRGTLKSGRSGKRVKSRQQAIAIGLSQARREGGKVPRKKSKKK
jgi:Family of unknown function (DUF6496)